MPKLPPLVELRAFEAAARHLSFKKAAVELCVTPTAISHQIRQLERYCGQSLFRRHPRPVALTETGARLFPVVHDGFEAFAKAMAGVKREGANQPLRLTTTAAFASRWLVPRLSLWRQQPDALSLEVIGTDSVLDLRSEADLAIRSAAAAPKDGVAKALFRESFWPICSPRLLSGQRPLKRAAELRGQILIHFHWSPSIPNAATWQRWFTAAQRRWRDVPGTNEMDHLSFRDELHAVEAVLAGQGIGLLSDLLVGDELKAGTLVKALDVKMSILRFYLVHPTSHPRQREIHRLSSWLQSVR